MTKRLTLEIIALVSGDYKVFAHEKGKQSIELSRHSTLIGAEVARDVEASKCMASGYTVIRK